MASNSGNWQAVVGGGHYSMPYFRVLSPWAQSDKNDPNCEYIKKWVPELTKVPKKFIHKPWEMEKKYQEAIKTIIGKDYPAPLVKHEVARQEALNAFQSLKKN